MADYTPLWLPPLLKLTAAVAPPLAARIMGELISRPRGRNPTQPWELAAPAGQTVELRPGLFAETFGDEGPLLLALHGWRGRTSQFRPLGAMAAARGMRLVALDLPGHGGSAGKHATPRQTGDLLIGLAHEIGPVHAAIGHSFGGAVIGAALAAGFRATRLVMLSSPTRVSRIPVYYANRMSLPERAMPHFLEWLDRDAGRPAAELDLVATGPTCGMPALLVHDREDAVIPYSEAEALIAAWPGLEVMTTTGKGHRDILSHEAVLKRVLEFVAGTA